MPKKVTPVHIRKWREILSEGKTYQEIAMLTGWQTRTVGKYLDSDIKSGEVIQIRRELYKERLGLHWDMLLKAVLGALGSLQPLSPGSEVEWIASSRSDTKSMVGATVQQDEKRRVSVRAHAKDLEEWTLLRQHMPMDPLWRGVDAWEAALQASLLARRKLYEGVEAHLKEVTGLPISEGQIETPCLVRQLVNTVFLRIAWRAGGAVPARDELPLSENSQGWLLQASSSTFVAYAPGRKDEISQAIETTIDGWSRSPEAAACQDAYARHNEVSRELSRALTHLRLLPYLPGVCSVCGRVELY